MGQVNTRLASPSREEGAVNNYLTIEGVEIKQYNQLLKHIQLVF